MTLAERGVSRRCDLAEEAGTKRLAGDAVYIDLKLPVVEMHELQRILERQFRKLASRVLG